MINVKKIAKEIAREHTNDGTTRINESETYDCCIEMGEWLYSQFKTELEKLMNRFNEEESNKAYFSIETLQDFYNRLLTGAIEPL